MMKIPIRLRVQAMEREVSMEKLQEKRWRGSKYYTKTMKSTQCVVTNTVTSNTALGHPENTILWVLFIQT